MDGLDLTGRGRHVLIPCQVVGEAKAGDRVNPATGILTLQAGERVQVTLKMQLEFEGKFTVKALNPTTMATYGSLELQTDYTV